MELMYGTLGFVDSGKLIPPRPIAGNVPSSGIEVAELRYDVTNKQLLVGYNATTFDRLVMSLAQGSGISLTGTYGRLTVAVGATVVQTSGDFSLTGKISLAGGAFVPPVSGSAPGSPVEGQLYWDSGTHDLFGRNTSGGGSWDLVGGASLRTTYAKSYHHQQGDADTTWTVAHGLGTTSVVYVLHDNSGNPLLPDSVAWTDANTMTFTFLGAQDGTADLVGVSDS